MLSHSAHPGHLKKLTPVLSPANKTGNLAEEIDRLKKQNGKDILVFAGANFVSSLVNKGHIDEYHLIINATAMAIGMTIFTSPDSL